jgi:membrane protease subunit HflC
MPNRILIIGLIIVGALAVALSTSLFIVPQTQQALVLQFGEIRRTVRDPGLQVKLPWQSVMFYDKRLVDLDPPVQSVILADQKRLDVDAYARFRIIDPRLFNQRVRDEANARTRLAPIVNSSMRRVLGNATLANVLSADRDRIMADIQKEVNEAARDFGIEIVDVRLRRADLPQQTSEAIFNRMRSEREREAKEARAQGEEERQRIQSRADRDRAVLLAEAQREAQTIRGEGDGLAVKIYADAFGRDPNFFAFYRSMQAYRDSMTGPDTTMVLSPEMSFFRFMNNPNAIAPSAPAKP